MTAIGAGIGGVTLVILAVLLVFYFIRWKKRKIYNGSFQGMLKFFGIYLLSFDIEYENLNQIIDIISGSSDGNSSIRASDEYMFDVRIQSRDNDCSDNDSSRFRTL